MQAAQDASAALDETALYAWFIPIARAFFMRHGGGGEAHDLAHEAFAIGLASLRAERVRDRERVGGFMLGVCRNLVRDRARKDARTERAMTTVSATRTISEQPVTATSIDSYKLWQCVNALNARARAVVLATYVDDDDADTIAQRERITAGNVRVMRHRALASLLACLERGAT